MNAYGVKTRDGDVAKKIGFVLPISVCLILGTRLDRSLDLRARIAWSGIYNLAGFVRRRWPSRTSGPPPFSSMNSTPANLSAPVPIKRAVAINTAIFAPGE